MTQKNKSKSKSQFGLFLFFVVGLFALQIAFAFTIHGDIGPQTDVIPCIDKPASPFLVGRIDSLVSNARTTIPTKVVPEGAFAPASRNMLDEATTFAKIETEVAGDSDTVKVRNTSESRFYEYRIRPGDTLEKISRKLYGSSRMIQPLIRLNRIKDEKSLQLGSALLIPKNGLLDTIKVF
ncbi:MAG: hypothetical protein PWR01_2614 [Clostridiales bacterium]|jgi:LysM repeat protein|nr:hypothetical protein [Clostridiales bacterium]MDN5281541.1 hypothetical protein [Candidatus Ozemobacter sp.]